MLAVGQKFYWTVRSPSEKDPTDILIEGAHEKREEKKEGETKQDENPSSSEDSDVPLQPDTPVYNSSKDERSEPVQELPLHWLGWEPWGQQSEWVNGISEESEWSLC